jgi:hypothetical protein
VLSAEILSVLGAEFVSAERIVVDDVLGDDAQVDEVEDEPLWTPPKIRANKFDHSIAIKWAGWGGRWWLVTPTDPPSGHWDNGPDADFDRGEWMDPTTCPHEDIRQLTDAVRRKLREVEGPLKILDSLPWG